MQCCVVTGGGRGVGRAITEHLVRDGDVIAVVVERDAEALGWIDDHPAAERLLGVRGDAGSEATAARYVTGAVLPIDGGRSVHGPDPEAVQP